MLSILVEHQECFILIVQQAFASASWGKIYEEEVSQQLISSTNKQISP